MRGVALVVVLLSGCISMAEPPAWHESLDGFCYQGILRWEQPVLLEALDDAEWPVSEEARRAGLRLTDAGLVDRWEAPRLVRVEWTDPSLEPRVAHEHGGWPSLDFTEEGISVRATFWKEVPEDQARADLAAMLGEVLGWTPAHAGDALRAVEPREESMNGSPAYSFHAVLGQGGEADAFVHRVHAEADEQVASWDGFGVVQLETPAWQVDVSVPVRHLEAGHGGGVSMLRVDPEGRVEFYHALDRVLTHDELSEVAVDAVAEAGLPVPPWVGQGAEPGVVQSDCAA